MGDDCDDAADVSGEQQEPELFVLCLQADPKGPSFETVFCNTEQMLKVDQEVSLLSHTSTCVKDT